VKTKHKPEPSRATRFACHAAEARAVFLAGAFNDWKADATPMVKDSRGDWSITMDLPPGRYEFKFVIDGVWCCEPGGQEVFEGAADRVPNSLGTMNRVIEVQNVRHEPRDCTGFRSRPARNIIPASLVGWGARPARGNTKSITRMQAENIHLRPLSERREPCFYPACCF
jgi:1,4-alpha-glucan branching enzyme